MDPRDEEILAEDEDETALAIDQDELDELLEEIVGSGGGSASGHGHVGVSGVAVTVVHETSSSGSSSDGGGAVSGGGSISPVGVVVDGSAGGVVGTATFDAQTGAFEASGTDTTVVEETSTPSTEGAPVDTSRSVGAGGARTDVGPATPEPGSETEPSPTSGTMPQFLADPNTFVFRSRDGRWEAKCVKLGIVFLVAGKPASQPVFVFVGIKIDQTDPTGKTVTLREAQIRAAVAATEAAAPVVEALNLALIPTSEAEGMFRREMQDVFRRTGGGATAGPCFGTTTFPS